MDPFKLLLTYNIPVVEYAFTKTLSGARKKASQIGYPVVLKVGGITHKTDVGGVILDIWDEHMLDKSFRHLVARFPGKPIMVQKQVKRGIELYVGAKNDKTFGPLILFGIGGVYVEVFKDITTRLCPITRRDVDEMIEELKAKSIILGYRGKPININCLKQVLLNTCKLIMNEKIRALDINPIKADERGCVVVDARVE